MKIKKICLVGLGYVGLPLAIAFGIKRHVIGFDTNIERINQLKSGLDTTLEVTAEEISNSFNLSFTNDIDEIKDCSIYIITVPTPIDSQKKPDLDSLVKASESVGLVLSKGDIVIYESTVYPGATEELCIPILQKKSKLIFNQDFYCGYSPERINPGDKEHRLVDIKKITSGSTPEIADEVDKLYNEIILAGTYKADSIIIAEAAKVIENTQRDVNIALINELALIFNKLGIDTQSVLEAASTKWNFLNFSPGLVGGHCIGVDPYYLTYKAIDVGYNPKIILAGRNLNDKMGSYVFDQVIRLMNKKSIVIEGSNILIMGLTFKENCPDIRNTRVVDIVEKFKESKCNVDVYDPWVDKKEAFEEYQIQAINAPIADNYDAIILAVGHEQFKKLSSQRIKSFAKKNHVLYDIKYVFKKDEVDGRL